MPWPSRLIPNPSAQHRNTPNQRDKPCPQAPGFHGAAPPPAGSQASAQQHAYPGGNGSHSHNRSASHPLPSIFKRKKSGGQMNGRFRDDDVPLDDTLVPVLDEDLNARPTRVISGKRKGLEEEDKVARKCMCCDARLSVPRSIDRFRCTQCVTINDLKSKDTLDFDELIPKSKVAEGNPNDAKPDSKLTPISVQQTKAIIDRCILAYLEARCRVQRPPPMGVSSRLDPASSITTRPLAARKVDTPAIRAAPTPPQPVRKPPPPPISIGKASPSQHLKPTALGTQNAPRSPRHHASPKFPGDDADPRRRYERVKTIFRPLEDYIARTVGEWECLNTSFNSLTPTHTGRTRSESNIMKPPSGPVVDFENGQITFDASDDLEAKLLLLGNIGEDGSRWTGKADRDRQDGSIRRKRGGEGPKRLVNSRSPNIEFDQLAYWYGIIHRAGDDWIKKVPRLRLDGPGFNKANIEGNANVEDISRDFAEAREHAIRALLKINENIVKRPGRPLKEPQDLRFLLIIAMNPSFYPSKLRPYQDPPERSGQVSRSVSGKQIGSSSPQQSSPRKLTAGSDGSKHTGILKRVLGLLGNTPDGCHRYFIGWMMRFDEKRFVALVDLVSTFVTHRIGRAATHRPRSRSGLNDGGLIPDFSSGAASTSAQLHSALGLGGSLKKRTDDGDNETPWANDWQLKAAAKVMSLLFAANNSWQDSARTSLMRYDSAHARPDAAPHANAKRSGQLLHTSYFYNTLLDYHDLITDLKVWETRRDKFSFCQYPLFLSMGAKIKILEYDARRQMESKAREAYFDNVIRARASDGYFHLRVRRDCVADDSFRQISEASGAGTEEFKKGLRVHFQGEEGVDAGGPRKEWFLMIVREIFDPNHGLFTYDEETNLCYFNPDSFESSQLFYFAGALLGLAIYNTTILDVALPPFAFRKLLAAAPSSAANNSNVTSLTGTKGQMTYSLADLAEYRPSLAAGLKQLLEFEGDVETTYCRDFVAPVNRYGVIRNEPLGPNGENTPVTNANRHDFVDKYVRYLLDTSVSRQFEPFKRGFFSVCAGNALSLFRAEEIELLIRGSDEALDVDSLKGVAVYENWKSPEEPHTQLTNPIESVPVISWFWEAFAQATPQQQRKLLTFITGSDRIPAVGATSLVLRVVAGGDGWGGGGKEEKCRFPIARTCFNMLVLWHYTTREQLEGKLWRAIEDSEGFGLK
ncbi:hypothetical protein K431DRAFT_223538 [Polychaeton citri CBS 116435]|uniref:HECT-type E3 ubiquitin transferase n=1 Tax=Polychaeton citri CBS 116435 TaxID=1314669 RepID=A0A9P4Q6V0_9PEZI|nr:hypothetical protein K431DRAFT_223538 [Polychaeton citri CBS 116435]